MDTKVGQTHMHTVEVWRPITPRFRERGNGKGLETVDGFPRLATFAVASFSALEIDTGYAYSHTWGCMFSRACQWQSVFSRLPVVACFPALDTDLYVFSRTCGRMFSRVWHHSHVFVSRVLISFCVSCDWLGVVAIFLRPFDLTSVTSKTF